MFKEDEHRKGIKVVNTYVVSRSMLDSECLKIHLIEENSDGTIFDVILLNKSDGKIMSVSNEISKDDFEVIKKNVIFYPPVNK